MAESFRAIEHVVVLMFENRSFDHMLGYLRGPDYPVEGLRGTEFNRENPADSTSRAIPVSNDAPYAPSLNPTPNHDLRDVIVQLFGSATIPDPVEDHNNGFVLDYAQITGNTLTTAHRIMQCYDPSKLPVLATLAREFAVCDHWHSSVPGPTWPNRFFLHAATSAGSIDNNVHPYTMRTIYQNLADHGLSWKIYFHDTPQALALTNLRSSLANFALFEESFKEDCASGRLPSFSFIEPRYFDFLWLRANDQHPPHSVIPGELLLADVYESLRRSPVWPTCALVVLWDEHGGIYDHVLPPRAPNPDGKTAPEFDFTRLGVRVPAIVVSPLVARGTIDSSVYDHSSVPAFAKRLFGLPSYLTARDAAANTFERVFTLDEPRQDAPLGLARPPVAGMGTGLFAGLSSAAHAFSAEAITAAKAAGLASAAPLTDLQTSLVALSHDLPLAESPGLRAIRRAATTSTEHDAAVHVLSATARLLGR